MEQKSQFFEIQVNDLKKQLDDNKKIHENALNALEGTGDNKLDVNKELIEMKEEFNSKVNNLI